MYGGWRRSRAQGSLAHFRRDHQLENVVSAFRGSHSCAKDAQGWGTHVEEIPGTPTVSPAEALKAELEKKDAEIKRLTRELDQARMKSASAIDGEHRRQDEGSEGRESAGASRGQSGAGAVAHAGRSVARQDWVGSGGSGLGVERQRCADCGSDERSDRARAGGQSDWPGGAESWRQRRGRPDLAEAGGKDASALDAALDGAYGVVESLAGDLRLELRQVPWKTVSASLL